MSVDERVADLVARGRQALVKAPNRFLELVEAGPVETARLRVLAGELFHLVSSDRQSFALLAARFPEPLFLAMAGAEDEALALLLDFGAAVGVGEDDLRAHEPRPLAQAYPAYLARTAVFGPRGAVPLALLVNVEGSGGTYARLADALQAHGFTDQAVAHFRFFAETPQEVLDQAAEVVARGLDAGDDPVELLRAARMVDTYEAAFWSVMTE
ncbi:MULTISPECIES: hypothetical protein [unclassified Saccharothrix]|uniref:hypothetical protein n=1 Tax=unclassified Saccharothrix TaxID=2593673 RepID=UPI00307E4D0D